ncbi:winged helix-turn-helix domain-containing protein [Halobacterium wangiae]|uniref:winged helix-turn-helix domain-containing protein n=1 Tax=Halobacterium wangiae TaxID=2902623 RepID=UPI001E409EF3|nr:winged helix-turn-helix domain-containing protein [Halobacterium wangiae]
MAIPHWTWPDDAPASGTDLAAASDAFDTLSDRTRAAILGTLFDADGPVAYTDLLTATGVEDNGRLNYHLRRLDGLVDRGDDGYVLTDRGRAMVRDVLAADALAGD